MARFFSPVLWTTLGALIAVAAMLAGGRVHGQQQASDGELRLVLTPAITSAAPIRMTTPSGPVVITQPALKAFFVRDTKSQGCWIAALGSDGQFASIAVAPPSACQ
jgi:hypothetical protein